MPAPAAPIRRLGTLNKSGHGTTPIPKKKAKVPTCCDSPDPVEDDGRKVCANCGTQISESNIVADVTFQEDSRGAAQVQGGFIGEGARHARTLGSALRRIGGGDRNASQEVEANGRRLLGMLCPRLNIPDATRDGAQKLYSLAAGGETKFNRGRRSDEVMAACLYAACRRNRDNTVLLMDLAEIIKVNVFRLGEVYKDVLRSLYYSAPGATGTQQLVEVEPMIERFCRKLEFGEKTRAVASDAVRILKRMKRDWMVTGRHPAGLCAACIILAARMNNFRRSVREMVYITKVADVTIAQRIHEFRQTKAAALTVDQFREFAPKLKYQHDPPVLAKSALQKEKWEEKKRKRQDHNTRRETLERERESMAREAIEISDDDSDSSSPTPSSTPEPEQEGEGQPRRKRQKTARAQTASAAADEPRFDSDGFAVPAIPAIDPALDTGRPAQQREGKRKQAAQDHSEEEVQQEAPPAKRKCGRPRKRKPEPMQITEEELTVEQDIEDEIDEALNDPDLEDSRTEVERAKAEESIKLLADQQRQHDAVQTQERREATGIDWFEARAAWERGTDEVVTEQDLEAEFANDPEVMHCKLSDSEAIVKEQIWVAHNEDWLRAQHEKQIEQQIAEASGANKKVDKRKRKKGKMGDGSLLLNAETPIETPEDAVAAMLKKNADPQTTRYVDFERLKAVYGTRSSPAASASSEGRAASEPAQAGADDEGEGADEEHEGEGADDEGDGDFDHVVDTMGYGLNDEFGEYGEFEEDGDEYY
ncbi:hypothetical protein B0A50_03950 [Salinomyces thailandicus]|uniref:Cyclin-like domain-containing protein n=1 Tax=Salinomyces thailandicus TaxID=706561 RepID=A0A4U0U0Q5_9PEZI|nr:hypothetical protein B0A50_03950 [Salinomyces thailandica]